MTQLQLGLTGYCSQCGKEHSLPAGNSKKYCLDLMALLKRCQRLDYLTPHSGNPELSTATLFSESRGKMFGVLEGIDHSGKIVHLCSFSGQYNGYWTIPGWVAPLFDVSRWQDLTTTTEGIIKKIGRQMENLPPETPLYASLKGKRKQLSQKLMVSIHSLYRVGNFRDQYSPLDPFFSHTRGIPTGTGDCCGPKLLHHAQQNNILPLGIAEFFWGKTNKSGTRHHGDFYPACQDKCYPLMGFMLCGLDEKRKNHKGLHENSL